MRTLVLGAGCAGVEPAPAGVGNTLIGGLYCPGDKTGDACTFTARRAEIRAGEGVAFRYGTTVERPRADGNRVTAASGAMTAVSC